MPTSGDRPITLLGADGQPLMRESDRNEGALNYLERAGVARNARGDLVVPPEALERLRAERLRDVTMTNVPHTPRWMYRDVGGVAVPKGHGRFETMTLRGLRKIRERSPMLQAIHSARHYQVRRVARKWDGRRGEVGWKVCHKDFTDWKAHAPEGFQPFVERFESIFECPSQRYCATTASALSLLEEDLLTINRPVVEVLYSLVDKKRVVGFQPIDGEIIWPTLLFVEKWMLDNPNWSGRQNPQDLRYEDSLNIVSEAIGWDLFGAEWALVRDGVCEAVYPAHKLIVAPIRNRTNIDYAGYPPSHVEQAIEIILAGINTWDLNASYTTRGMLTEFFLGITGDVPDEDIQGFVDQLREATQGVRNAWGVPVIPLPDPQSTIQKIDLRPTLKDMVMDLWMSVQASLLAAVYRMDLSAVNMKPWDPSGGGKLAEGNREMEISLAKEEGLQGDVSHLCDGIFNVLAKRCHPDLRVQWQYGDFDAEKEARVYEISTKVAMTRNEVRLEQGRKPMGFWVPDTEYDKLEEAEKKEFDDNLWNMPADPGFVSAVQQRAMAEQMQQQQQGGDGFGGGQPGGFGGGPDGQDGPGQGSFPYGQAPGGGQPPAPPPQAPAQGGGGAPPGGAPGPGPRGSTPMPMNKARAVTVYVQEE